VNDEQGYSHERELGRRLARLRDAAGLTQRELARRMDLTQSALSRIESGQRRLSAAQVSQLARILAIDPGVLLEADPADAGGPFAAEVLQSSQSSPEPWDGAGAPRSNARSLRAEGARGRAAGQRGRAASPTGSERLAMMSSDSSLARMSSGDASWAKSFTEDLAARAAADVPRGRARSRGLEPPLFAEVVRDALEVEALAGTDGEPRLPDFGGPSPFAALPHATHADPVRLARFWRHELGVGDEGPLPDLVPLLEATGVDVVHARLDSDTPHGACALVAAPEAGGDRAAAARAAAARAAAVAPSRTSASAAAPAAAAAVRAFVFVNGFARPVALQRFALAHEFAHLALGHGEAYDERIDWSGRSRHETDANAFAEEFVAPLAAVRRWFEMDSAAAGSRAVARDAAASPHTAAASPAASPRDPATEAVDTVVRLANHFGVSFWVARYRAKAAGILSSPTQLRAVDQLLRARQSQMIPRQLFLGGLRDTLSVLTAESRPGQSKNPWRIAPNGVRVPGRMRAQVLALLEAGAVPLEQAAAWLRIDPAELRVQLEQFGLE
jgi:transcriptional regulator with XRE-family HTH domain/Zn-dependent peptidase ImmA (M78 family)